MNTNIAIQPIRAVVLAEPPNNLAQVIHVALTLHRHDYFEVTVVGCVGISGFGILPAVPAMMGGPTPNIGAEMAIERNRNATQKLCDKISRALEALPENDIPRVGYIEGSFRQIAATLSSTFDLIVLPRPLEPPNMLGCWYPDFDTRLALSKPAPTLFCVRPLDWHSIIIVRTGDQSSWWATQILSRMSIRLDTPVYQWFQRKIGGSQLPPSLKAPILLPVPEIIGPLDAA
ncbi:MAG: hypothetical protein ACE5PV_10195, partial [Candidatus Poribacteria bacterium]